MNIVVSANSKYAKYLYVMLESLYKNNLFEEIQTFILQRDFITEDFEILKELNSKYNNRVHFIRINENDFPKLPVSDKFPLEAYFRLMLAEVLPQNISKVLYLDVDIIVRGSLHELYMTDIDDVIAAVCCDMYRPIIDEKKYNLFRRTGDKRYFNSGVMLINVSKLREQFSFERFMLAAEELGFDLQYADQEILNFLLFDKVTYLPAPKYNYLVLSTATEDLKRDEAVILHYAGCNPWQVGKKNELYRIWWEYAKDSPFYVELIEKQLWRAEGLDDNDSALSMREVEIRGILEVAFNVKSKGYVRKWLIHNDKKVCIYGAGAMAEVLYEILLYDEIVNKISHVWDYAKQGIFHGVLIEQCFMPLVDSVVVVTPAYNTNQIVNSIKEQTGMDSGIYSLKEFLYEVVNSVL